MSSEAEKKEQEKKEPDLIPVGPGADDEEKGEKFALDPSRKAAAGEEDEDEDEPEDKRLASDEDEDKPGRPKETAKERRERQKRQRSRERQELEFYRKRNEQLEKEHALRLQQIEGRQDQLSTAAIDQRIAKIEEHLSLADTVSFEALKAGTREDYAKAQGIRDQLQGELARLRAAKGSEQQRKQQPQVQQPTVDPVVQRKGRDWASDNAWFDPDGTDPETLLVRALDESVDQEGFDPRTDEYWEELTKRCRKYLPHRFKTSRNRVEDDDDGLEEDRDVEVQDKRRPQGPRFSSGGRERSLRKGEVYISADRKQAMKDAGMWDDPVQRQRMLKRYSEMDAELSASRY